MKTNIERVEKPPEIEQVTAKRFPAILTQLVRGLGQSASIVVNRRDWPDILRQNREDFTRDGRDVTRSAVRHLTSAALRMCYATE